MDSRENLIERLRLAGIHHRHGGEPAGRTGRGPRPVVVRRSEDVSARSLILDHEAASGHESHLLVLTQAELHVLHPG